MQLDSTFRHHLLMIVKEALHNIVAHSAASVVTLHIAVEGTQLLVEIADNGHGLPTPETMKPGNGLQNMKSRALDLGGSCDFLAPETGTRHPDAPHPALAEPTAQTLKSMSAPSSTEPIRVALVEDHGGLRDSLHEILSTTEGIACVAACAKGEQALAELPAPRRRWCSWTSTCPAWTA